MLIPNLLRGDGFAVITIDVIAIEREYGPEYVAVVSRSYQSL